MKVRWAAIQMCSGVDVDENLDTAGSLIAEAARDGAALVCLPENFALMPKNPGDLVDCARRREDDIDAFLAGQARSHGIVLIGGSVPAPSPHDGRVYGSCRVYSGDGVRVAVYEKMHLFDVVVSDSESYRESAYTAPGSRVVSADTAAGRIGLTICYDMRFPELYRRLAIEGVQAFSVPSAFTVPTGRAHWEVLLRARAIENLSFVIAPAQYGEHANGRKTWGHSMIAGPWGEVLACLPEGEGICCADVDLSVLEDIRARLPALDHRRL